MTIVEKLQPKDKLSYSFKVSIFHDEKKQILKDEFLIPVVDVRDGQAYVDKVRELERGDNSVRGSKFIKPTITWIGATYNQSMKKKK